MSAADLQFSENSDILCIFVLFHSVHKDRFMREKTFIHYLLFFLLVFSASPISAQFTEVSLESGMALQHTNAMLIGGGGAFFDYNNDGWLDIYLVGGNDDDGLFHNNGDGTFTNVSEAAGLESTSGYQTTGVITGDVDKDGYRDVFVMTWDTQANLLLHNNGDGTFTEMGRKVGLNGVSFSMAASFGDFNLDGYLDLYVGNYIEENGGYTPDDGFGHICSTNFFYVNQGDGTFEEVSEDYGLNDNGCTLSVAFTDLDNDNDADLLLANDFGEWVTPNAAFENLHPSNSFSNVAVEANLDLKIYAMGIAIGDYNEDGLLDYYMTNIGHNPLLKNRGGFQFEEVAQISGVDNTYSGTDPETGNFLFATSWGAAFLDYNNDTYLDLFVSNGHVPAVDAIKNAENDPNKLFRNNQANGTFTDMSSIMGIANSDICRGMATGDYDNDGDMDILVVAITAPSRPSTFEDHIMLFRNDNPPANWLKVELEGVNSNKEGIGSRVEVSVDGRTFIREIDGGSSHASHNSTIAHFGLADYEMVDEVRVKWLGGEDQIFTNVAANQLVSIKEGESTAIEEQTARLLQLHTTPNPFQTTTQIHYSLPKASTVSLEIYDVTGRLVDAISHNKQTAGSHTIDWKPAAKLTSGVYFCRMTTDFGIASHRLVIDR